MSNTPRSMAAIGMVPALVVLAFALLLPVGFLVAMGFKPAMPGVFNFAGDFTLGNYIRFFKSPFYYGTLLKTLWVAGLTTVITLVIGYVLALLIWSAPPRRRSWVVLIVLSPLLVSIVARTYGWMIVLGDKGMINSVLMGLGLIHQPLHMLYTQGAIVVGLVHVFVPFMALCILTSLDKLEPYLLEAASTFGASRWQTLRHVLLPLSLPGIASGLTIVFSLSISSYVTPELMGGSRSGMLTSFIYQQFAVTLDWRFGAVLVTVLLAVTLIVLATLLRATTFATRHWSRS